MERPRITYYSNERRIDDRFTHYFFDGASKVTIAKEIFGEVGVEVNWFIAKFGGKIGGNRGETVEIDVNEIPMYNKAFLVEYHSDDKGLLVDPVNGNISPQEVLYKSIGESYISRDLAGPIRHLAGYTKVEDIIDEKVGKKIGNDVVQLIENERSRQEKSYIDDGGEGKMYVWLLPSSNRTVASIFSITKIDREEFSSYGAFRRELGFIGSFESSVPVNNAEHTILFLTPLWIWHD